MCVSGNRYHGYIGPSLSSHPLSHCLLSLERFVAFHPPNSRSRALRPHIFPDGSVHEISLMVNEQPLYIDSLILARFSKPYTDIHKRCGVLGFTPDRTKRRPFGLEVGSFSLLSLPTTNSPAASANELAIFISVKIKVPD